MAGWWTTIFSSKGREKKKLRQQLDATSKSLKEQYDALDVLKKDIEWIEKGILYKKKEYESITGNRRQIVANEVKLLYRKLKDFNGRSAIINSNIDKLNLFHTKIQELIYSTNAVSEEEIDNISISLEDKYEVIRNSGAAAEELRRKSIKDPLADSSIEVKDIFDSVEYNTNSTSSSDKNLGSLDHELEKIFAEISEGKN